MFVLFTDFGTRGPYVGQMQAVLMAGSDLPVVDLMHDAPAFDPRASAYLLRAFVESIPVNSIIVAVVDPGVGSRRRAIAARADGRWLVGPDNGLLAPMLQEAPDIDAWELDVAGDAAATFHGRDVFAPAAVRIASGLEPSRTPLNASTLVGMDWPADESRVIYVDAYGNVMTGLRGSRVPGEAMLCAKGHRVRRANTFSDVGIGEAFWYVNSSGLVEVAINQGNARERLGMEPGAPVALEV
ncbi:SAM-dependent chlorinase/fluorinase [Ectothiorhodospiraceae bacterium WFHF3C12]|nr:SAM-dependent chlorinase/fluorinase [Ectothiorhodospiraceae bacterium WFHF3C12]